MGISSGIHEDFSQDGIATRQGIEQNTGTIAGENRMMTYAQWIAARRLPVSDKLGQCNAPNLPACAAGNEKNGSR